MADRNISEASAIDENKRLAELRSLDILNTPPEERFDRFTRLVAEIFKVPIATVTMVDEDRQWFKSVVGRNVRETCLDESLCVHALEHDLLEIPDAQDDPFFRHHSAVVGSPFIRFYTGVVLRGPTGQPLGTLCIIDIRARYLTEVQRSWLVTLGKVVEEQINHLQPLAISRQQVNHATSRYTRTGLPDETLFGDTLTNLIRLADSQGHFLAVLHLRLNNLDEIGRFHGRSTRDKVLHCLAERLTAPDIKVVAAGHLSLARFGAVIQLPSARDLFDVITPIVNKLTSAIELAEETILPDIDVGISVSQADGTTPEDLLEKARVALKFPRSPEGVHVFSREAEGSAVRRHAIEQRLQSALLGEHLIQHYQPQVLADGSRIVGFEALARWQDTKLGNVSPGEFVPVAERSAYLSRLLTDWSLRAVCQKARYWPLQPRDPPLRMAVNIPAAEFYQRGFLDRVLDTLETYQLSPDRLTLELTEASLLVDIEKSIQTMRDLRDHNIAVALDDFGTGYSSLSYLKRLPIDNLKIDKSFINDLPFDPRAVDLIDGILRIARGLGLHVVAEGVETEGQRAILLESGCNVLQGYLFSRPVAADEALDLLTHWPPHG